MHQTRLLIYSDHLGDKVQPVRRLYREAKTRPLVQAFLRQAVDIFRYQHDTLDLRERSSLGDFSDLIELAEHHACREQNLEAVSFALTTVIQVAEFLMLVIGLYWKYSCLHTFQTRRGRRRLTQSRR